MQNFSGIEFFGEFGVEISGLKFMNFPKFGVEF
jgi:hypothetical protein